MKRFFLMFVCIFALIIGSGNEKVSAEGSSIVGTDDRVPISDISKAPYNSMVNIIAEFSYGQTSGTGFFISDHVVATAAHCVYDADRKEYAKSVSIYVPTKNNTWGGPYKIDKIEINPRYISWVVGDLDLSGSLTDDYAALILNAPLSKDLYPDYWKNFRLYKEGTLTDGMSLNLAGVLPKNGRTVYMGTGKLLRSNQFVMIYDMDSEGGMSGGPVYKESTNKIGAWNYDVYGIHNAVYDRNKENGAVRITDEVYNWYTNIMNKKNQPSILNGGYIISPLSASDKALRVPNSESSEHVYQATYTNSENWADYQFWTIQHVQDGKYKITNNKSGKVLEVARGDMAQETPIIQFPYTGEDEQLWRISLVRTISDGWLKEYECVITNVKTGQVLDMTGSSTSNYTEAIQFPYHGGNNQRFKLTRKWA